VILVGIGANLPGPDGSPAIETCRKAVVELDRLPGLRVAALSRWFATTAQPPTPGTPDYVNGVARLTPAPGHVAPDPAALLAALQVIEARFGRARPYRLAPRTLDLDLLDLDGFIRRSPSPILPHPRMASRAFVLAPLLDVAPVWRHPITGRSGADLLAALVEQRVRPVS